jgi:hypothetical protein
MTDLATRVLNAIPAGAYEMTSLLSLLRIEETDAVATASVSCERRPVLRINPEFVRRHCRTDEHLFLLVMHELHHILLGHTRLFPRATPAHNVAFDAVINAMLVRRFPADAYRSFFLGLYGGQDGVLRLLAPPDGTAPAGPVLARLHHLLYVDDRATSEEVFNTIVEETPAFAIQGAVLLGNHGADDGSDWGTEGLVDAGFVQAIRDIVEKWPPPEHPVRGRSLAEVLARRDVAARDPAGRVLTALRRALLGAATRRTPGGAIAPRAAHVRGAVPSADRHASVLRASGCVPLLFRKEHRSRRGRTGRAQVYLDVSGSMDPYLPFLYRAFTALRQYLEPRVHLFSTEVRAIGLRDLQAGRVVTTGGTDIACVVESALRSRARKLLVVTDGYVGRPADAQASALRQARIDIRVALTPDGWRGDLEALAARLDVLPALDGSGR